MRLGHWNTVWLEFDFEPGINKHSIHFSKRGRIDLVSGYGAVERTLEHGRTFFCIYRSGGRIHFQAGNRCWALDAPGLRFEFQLLASRTASTFTVHEADEAVFRCTYRHWLRSRLGSMDPTYDYLDFQSDHFLSHIGDLDLSLRDRLDWLDAQPRQLDAEIVEPRHPLS